MKHPLVTRWTLALLLALATICVWTGCSHSPPAGAKKPADEESVWQNMVDAMEPPDPPRAWASKDPTPEHIARFHRESAGRAAIAAEAASVFYQRFPGHQRALRARVVECAMLSIATYFGNAGAAERLQSARTALGKEPALTDDERFFIRAAGVMRVAYNLDFKGYRPDFDRFEKDVRELQREFPQRTEPAGMLLTLARNLQFEDLMDRARTVATELAAASGPASVVEEAKAMVRRFARVGAPLPFQFTALDGRTVDFDQWRGKVVLVDCWATWCPPCIAELPHVLATFQRYHAAGLEIAGISSDDDRAALEKLVADKSIPWPQFFDGKGELNAFAAKYDITGLPTMWLLDKRGNLRDLNARKNLDAKIKALLAE